MSAPQRTSRYGGMLLLAATVLIGATVARANEQIHVGKAQGTAWTFLPVDVGIEQGFFAKQGLDIDSADLGGDAKVQQALAAGSIDIGLGRADRGWHSSPKARRRSALPLSPARRATSRRSCSKILPVERMAREALDTPQCVPLHAAAERFWRSRGYL